MTRTDHFDGRRFFNPNGANGQPIWQAPRLFTTRRAPWPAAIAVTPRQPPSVQGKQLAVSYVGHATFLIQANGTSVLTDPVYADRASPFQFAGPHRVRAPGIRFDDLPHISIVLLSHNHYDHCDLRTLHMLAERFDPLVLTPLGNAALVRSSGLRRVEELDWWQDAKTSALPITLTPAHHFSARGPLDGKRDLWGGFSLVAGGVRIFFAGDSAYASFFSDVRQRLGPIDLALLPIGAYEPRWFMHVVHMNPAEAVQAHIDLEASESIGMHFGTFRMTSEGIDEPLRALEEARRAKSISPSQFRTLGFGESLRI